jgi:SWI/SNF-related matrix-associated actin-dependent regulator 1 of chromatin subfamily A
MPEIRVSFDGPSKSRIVHEQSDSHGSIYSLFNCQHRKGAVRLAWQQMNGDARKPDLLQDQNWLCNPSGSTQPSPEMVSRVKEVDEAIKAQRAAVKGLGKNSLIYANRPTSRISTSPTSKSIISALLSPTSLSPDVLWPRTQRAKKDCRGL